MRLSDLVAEANESVWVHHASGHFSADEATARLVANVLSPDAAAELLVLPVSVALFDQYKTWPAEQETPR
jgi:hypothetical protein